ncbi:hypothetical protein 7865G3C2_38 [Haloquadratum phage sp.]|nr:hypothetical protein 7865G3C2_38 [Haloquadratum phage sp.]
MVPRENVSCSDWEVPYQTHERVSVDADILETHQNNIVAYCDLLPHTAYLETTQAHIPLDITGLRLPQLVSQ